MDSKRAGKGETQRKEDVKQAVIVDYKAIGCKYPGGDTNGKTFIQYSLEWLSIEEFEEVFVCCLPDNAQEMRQLIHRFLETEFTPKQMTIKVHSSENNRSTGDCLRDLDPRGSIKSDFVIMDVGCCGNLPLANLLESHKSLKKSNKNAILTSVVRYLFNKNPAEIGMCPVYISDPSTGLLMHYVAGRMTSDENQKNTSHTKSIEVPSRIFLEKSSVRVYTNLCSTNLSIYSANVPALFTELFDCHSEADMIQAAFDNQEVLGGTVYIHVVDDLFSQRVADFGFAINQKWDKFDTNLIYKRNERSHVLRTLVNDSLIDCTRLNSRDYLSNLKDDDSEDSKSESDSEDSLLDDDEAFLIEVLDSLVRGFEETIENENLVLEVNSSKHAYNIGIHDVYSTIAKALLLLPEKLNREKPKSLAEYSQIVEKAIDKFNQFLLNYMKSDESKAIVISAMEEIFLSDQVDYLNETVMAKILYKLYEIDALDEESILLWFKDYNEEDKQQKDLRSKPAMRQLIKAMETESDETESD